MTIQRVIRVSLSLLSLLTLLIVVNVNGRIPANASTVPARLTAFELIALPLPEGAIRAGVASIAWSGSTWWAAGSFRDSTNEHRPGLWWSTNGSTWTRTSTIAVTPYGEVSELYSVAASDRGVVAIGAATGGAHGNPRTVTWVLNEDRVLEEVPAPFELYNGPRQISVRTIVDGPGSWVIFGSRDNRNNRVGATSWTSVSGREFVIHDNDAALSSSKDEQTLGADVARQSDRLVAVGEVVRLKSDSADTDAIAWTSNDGETWKRWTPTGLRFGGHNAQRMQRIATSEERMIMAGTETDSLDTKFLGWTTINGSTWVRSVISPLGKSGDALTTVTDTAATSIGFFVGARINDELRLATSVNGLRWSQLFVSRDLPIGNRTVLAVGANADSVLVGATGLEGGGLWRARRR